MNPSICFGWLSRKTFILFDKFNILLTENFIFKNDWFLLNKYLEYFTFHILKLIINIYAINNLLWNFSCNLKNLQFSPSRFWAIIPPSAIVKIKLENILWKLYITYFNYLSYVFRKGCYWANISLLSRGSLTWSLSNNMSLITGNLLNYSDLTSIERYSARRFTYRNGRLSRLVLFTAEQWWIDTRGKLVSRTSAGTRTSSHARVPSRECLIARSGA